MTEIDPTEMFRICLKEAWNSPDPSTQNGAVIVSAEGHTLGKGCNEFPAGVEVTPERLERPMKYYFIEHAERNAIHDADVLLDSDEMYALWASCSDCATAIIQSGIRKLNTHSFYVGGDVSVEGRKDWSETIKYAFEMFDEAGVEVVFHDCQVMRGGESLLYNGEPVRF